MDVWKLVRSARSFVTWTCEYPTYHQTYRDGEHPHSTAQDGLESAPVHPSLAAAVKAQDPSRKAKHLRMGWPTRWSDIEHFSLTTGIGFIYPDDFPSFAAASHRSSWQRLVVPLAAGQGVQAMHYLARPTNATRKYLAQLSAMDGTFEIRIIDRWEPWSVVHVSVTKPGALQVSSAAD